MDSSEKPQKTRVYLPGLPDLSSSDVDHPVYLQSHQARFDLIDQIRKANMFTPNNDGYNPWLRDILPIVKTSDAFVFPPMTTLPENHPDFQKEVAKRWFELTSVITGAHVGNAEQFKNGVSKPNIVADPDGHYARLLDIYDDLHKQGVFSSDIKQIVQVADTSTTPGDYQSNPQAINAAMIQKLQETLDQKIGKPQGDSKVAKAAFADHKFESHRKDPNIARHPFGVLFFGSATTKNPAYIAASKGLAEKVGERGWRMITGVGNKGCMGAFDEGFNEGKQVFARDFPRAKYRPTHIGVSTVPIMQFEGEPKGLDQLILTDDIYDRMRVMIKGWNSKNRNERISDTSQVIVVAPGGTGTMQEFSAMMQLATNGDIMKGRKVIVLNIDHCWDKLIEAAKIYHFDQHFEVATSVEQALEIADKRYGKWQAELTGTRAEKYSNLPHPDPEYFDKAQRSPKRISRGRLFPDGPENDAAPPPR